MEVSRNGILEHRKRKREVIASVLLGLLFLLLTWVEYALFDTSRELPLVHTIFFLGLINFNIIILLLLMFLIFRNWVRGFTEKEGSWLGSSLKSKLIAAFVTFSLVPTILMFLVSVFYINNSFDKWFNIRTTEVLKNSIEVTNAYYLSAKKRNYHYASEVINEIQKHNTNEQIFNTLTALRKKFLLDAIEFYPAILGERIYSTNEDETFFELPVASLEFLKKGIEQKIDSSTIHHFDEGNLVRVIVPLKWQQKDAAIIISSYIPISLVSRMDDISAAYEDLRQVDPLQYPIKTIYLIILVMMTLVILMCATWFGIHLARQMSIPLEELGKATFKVAQKEYGNVSVTSGSEEINHLVENFNSMVDQLAKSEKEVTDANKNLNEILVRINDYNRYINVILANVNTGVIAVDQNGIIRTINRYAGQLLEINPEDHIGKKVSEVLPQDYLIKFNDTLTGMKKHQATMLQKEIQVNLKDRQLPIQVSVSLLHDDNNMDLGTVVVFDDLTAVQSAQRAAAWKEVARRIAHEIKNPLTPIKLSAQRLQKKFGDNIDDPVFKDCTDMIIKEADELKTMVNEFHQFSRMPQAHPVMSSLHGVIENLLILYRTGHKDITFAFQAGSNVPDFSFDPELIKRALMNLLENSVASLKNQNVPEITILTQYNNVSKIVRIEILDNGEGIPRNMLRKIFEPYVTMKEQGTGLGLAIVQRIIEDHNGFVRALANKTQGTRIVIELPIGDQRKYDVLIPSTIEREVPI